MKNKTKVFTEFMAQGPRALLDYEPFVVDFSAKEWQAIKDDVRRLGHDADTVKMRGRSLPAAVSGPWNPASLRQRLKWAYHGAKLMENAAELLPTAHQVAEYLTKKRAEALAFIKTMDSPLIDYGSAEVDGWDCEIAGAPSPIPEARDRLDIQDAVLRALLKYAEALESEAVRFRAAARRPNKNATKHLQARNRYLAGVLRVWHELGGEKASDKQTIDFLVNCAEPVFGEKEVTRSAVQNWFYRKGNATLKREVTSGGLFDEF
jgi:hypothetical protein